MTSATQFIDTSEDCAICLSPLSSTTSSTPCITLSCGHIYHKNCLLEQLEKAKPSPLRRITFNGCVCAKCQTFCEHPDLTHLTNSTRKLRDRVDELIRQLEDSALTDAELAEKRRRYAFYLCSLCEKPFFGGTVQCEEENNRHEISALERLCEQCSIHQQTTPCDDQTHGPSYVWKCRLCCSPSERVCFARTHLCEACHERFSSNNAAPPVPCPGRGVCQSPMPGGDTVREHTNGHGVECEQLLFCGLCRSSPGGRRPDEEGQRYSRNLLYNPSAELGTDGWGHFSPTCKWKSENSDYPFRPYSTNFVSAYDICKMAQVVDLSTFVSPDQHVRINVSARYRARPDCPSMFVLEASLLDEDFQEIEYSRSEELNAPPDFWDVVRHTLSTDVDGKRGRYVIIGLMGKDLNFWAGEYGSKVTDCNVSVILEDGTEDAVNEVEVRREYTEECMKALRRFREERERQLGATQGYLNEELLRRVREIEEQERQEWGTGFPGWWWRWPRRW